MIVKIFVSPHELTRLVHHGEIRQGNTQRTDDDIIEVAVDTDQYDIHCSFRGELSAKRKEKL